MTTKQKILQELAKDCHSPETIEALEGKYYALVAAERLREIGLTCFQASLWKGFADGLRSGRLVKITRDLVKGTCSIEY